MESGYHLGHSMQLAPGARVGSYQIVASNQPQESIDEYNKVDASAWDGVTIGTWRYARLATANHLLGRHAEELRIARVAKGLFPVSILTRVDELVALAALGRIDDLGRAVDDLATVPDTSGNAVGQAMRAAAEELRAHGHRADSIVLAQRSAAWYRNRPAQSLTAGANRFALAQSLYVAEEWLESTAIATALLSEQKDNAAYAS